MSFLFEIMKGFVISKGVEKGVELFRGPQPAQGQPQVRQPVARIENATSPQVSGDSVSFIDARQLRVFFPSVRIEVKKQLRAARPYMVDPNGAVVSLSYDRTGAVIPIEETADRWAEIRNGGLLILAPTYISFNIPARKFLRACLRSEVHKYAGIHGPYAVLFEIGECKRIGLRMQQLPSAANANTPPSIVVPSAASAEAAATPAEVRHVEAVEHPGSIATVEKEEAPPPPIVTEKKRKAASRSRKKAPPQAAE